MPIIACDLTPEFQELQREIKNLNANQEDGFGFDITKNRFESHYYDDEFSNKILETVKAIFRKIRTKLDEALAEHGLCTTGSGYITCDHVTQGETETVADGTQVWHVDDRPFAFAAYQGCHLHLIPTEVTNHVFTPDTHPYHKMKASKARQDENIGAQANIMLGVNPNLDTELPFGQVALITRNTAHRRGVPTETALRYAVNIRVRKLPDKAILH